MLTRIEGFQKRIWKISRNSYEILKAILDLFNGV